MLVSETIIPDVMNVTNVFIIILKFKRKQQTNVKET